LMTSQIGSRIEYLIPFYILMLLRSDFIKKRSSLITGFLIKFNDNSASYLRFWSHPVCAALCILRSTQPSTVRGMVNEYQPYR